MAMLNNQRVAPDLMKRKISSHDEEQQEWKNMGDQTSYICGIQTHQVGKPAQKNGELWGV